jgi:hypothetical protein
MKTLSDNYLLSLWRKAVRSEWGSMCALGYGVGEECHHIVPRRVRVLRYDVRNGIFLSKTGHRIADTMSGRERILQLLSDEDRFYLKKMEQVTLAQYLAKTGKTRSEWRCECANKLKETIKKGD